MKKVIMVGMAVMVAGIAAADLSVDWKNSNMPVYAVGGAGAAGPFIEGSAIQLMWSAAGAITTAGSYDLSTLGEFALDSQVNATYGTWNGGFGGIFTNDDVGGNDINTGFFFSRVFQSTGADGEYFVDVALGAGADFVYDPTSPNTTFSDNALGGAPATIDQNGTMSVVVPEPATLGLMGIAGLGMFLARRKAQR